MKLTWEQIRLLLIHEWRLETNATEAAHKINRAWGEDTVAERTARKWYGKFRAGEDSLEDQPRSGRPQEVDRQAVLAAVEETPSLTTRMLADDFNCDHSTIVRILNELGKVWMKTRWVPHELTPAQMTKRVNGAQTLLNRQNRVPFLDQLITGDEKWISFKNPNPQHEWRSPGEKSSARPKKDFRHTKAMLCVFWSARGVVHWELLEDGQTVNSDVYCQQLERVNQALGRRRGQVVFLDDNARPHRSRQTNGKISTLRWDRLDHPPYSPDLAPSDFHLFRSLQHFLKGKQFEDINQMREALQEFFDSKDADFYRRGIEKLPEKWQEVIDVEGDYYD